MHTNALSREKSPYLRQHANNPVDWLPWGEEAFARARREDKPIFLSIGYSTCHWCHVMAHESFEDERTASILNEYFVPVKVDREERPDIDRVYMLFVQASTGSGGWPMSVWLTPDLLPFYGGTYFPPDNRYGRPGFSAVLQHLAAAWHDDRAKILESSVSVTQQLQALGEQNRPTAPKADEEFLHAAFWQLQRSFDAHYGGFGSAPKFPRPATLAYLLRYWWAQRNEDALEMVTTTLRAMASGGIHDHLGGGFHRYSVDERWFVPHFEKMLYDQAQLAVAYLEAYQATGEEFYAGIVRDILGYVARDLTSPEGGFYSAEDADSTDPENSSLHGEGAFYIWRDSEIRELLKPVVAETFVSTFHVARDGNVDSDPHGEFSGRNILYRAISERGYQDSGELREAKQILFARREKRPRPHRDEKVLTSWNALMISSFFRAATVLAAPEFAETGRRALQFLRHKLYRPDSAELLRRYCDGEAAVLAFADDYAFLAQALLDAFEAEGRAEDLAWASELCHKGLERFRDQDGDGYFSSAASAADVILRLKDEYDGAEPSANSVAGDVLQRLAHLTGDPQWQARAESVLQWFRPKLSTQPTASPQALCAILRSRTAPGQTVLRSGQLDDTARSFAQKELGTFQPFAPVLQLPDAELPNLADFSPFLASLQRLGNVTRYRCQNLACELPEQLA